MPLIELCWKGVHFASLQNRVLLVLQQVFGEDTVLPATEGSCKDIEQQDNISTLDVDTLQDCGLPLSHAEDGEDGRSSCFILGKFPAEHVIWRYRSLACP